MRGLFLALLLALTACDTTSAGDTDGPTTCVDDGDCEGLAICNTDNTCSRRVQLR